MGVDNEGNPKQLGFADLDHVEEDLKLFKEKIVQYGFDDINIKKKKNLSMAAVKKLIS